MRVECELILAQNAKLFGPGNRAFRRVNLAGQNTHEGRFTGSVWSGNGVSATDLKSGGHIFEQGSGAEAHAHVVDGYQKRCSESLNLSGFGQQTGGTGNSLLLNSITRSGRGTERFRVSRL